MVNWVILREFYWNQLCFLSMHAWVIEQKWPAKSFQILTSHINKDTYEPISWSLYITFRNKFGLLDLTLNFYWWNVKWSYFPCQISQSPTNQYKVLLYYWQTSDKLECWISVSTKSLDNVLNLTKGYSMSLRCLIIYALHQSCACVKTKRVQGSFFLYILFLPVFLLFFSGDTS